MTALLPRVCLRRRYLTMPHYQLMRQVHLDHIPEAEHDWGPAPGEHAFTPEMLAKVRALSPMFWRCARASPPLPLPASPFLHPSETPACARL